MLDLPDTPEINGLKKYVPNYRLNLISPSRLKQGDFKKFSTNLGGILKYIKYSGDMDQLAKHAAELPLFEPDEAALINLITKSDLQYEVKDGKVDMCEAIRQMRVQSEAKGRTEGRNEGRAEGRAEGLMEGKLETLAELVKDNILTVAEAAKRANMTIKEFEKKITTVTAECTPRKDMLRKTILKGSFSDGKTENNLEPSACCPSDCNRVPGLQYKSGVIRQNRNHWRDG